MVLGDNAYEVMPGFLGTAIGGFSEHQANRSVATTDSAPKSEEALLAQYLLQVLE
jgi:hypothetical protein